MFLLPVRAAESEGFRFARRLLLCRSLAILAVFRIVYRRFVRLERELRNERTRSDVAVVVRERSDSVVGEPFEAEPYLAVGRKRLFAQIGKRDGPRCLGNRFAEVVVDVRGNLQHRIPGGFS